MQTEIARPTAGLPIFRTEGADRLFIRAGTRIGAEAGPAAFEADEEIRLPALVAGTDYAVRIEGGALVAAPAGADLSGAIGGFHFAPGGNAPARAGGDAVPAINPFSIWDAGFRPGCDPRGMTLVDVGGRRLWVDIYKLGVEHAEGTSRHGATIADGYKNRPKMPDGSRYEKLDFPTAVEIYAGHGKRLLTYDEFRAAACGVTERSAASDKPKTAGLDSPRTSRFGLMQATGNLWDWGTDGDPDDPRPSIFGASWIGGRNAGSRRAGRGRWPADSDECISARGCRDHES